MGDLIGYLLRQGFVRVAFVPMVMGVALWVLYVLAAPPQDHDEENGEGQGA
jgi:hypothetical protein